MSFFNIALLSLAGFVSGFIGSQVGAGSLFVLPALMYLGLSAPAAVAAHALAGLFTNGIGAIEYSKKHFHKFKLLLPLIVVASIGSVIGAKLLFILNPQLISKIFAVVFIALVLFLLSNSKSAKKASNLHHVNKLVLFFLAFVIGVYGGMIAVGVTTLAILFFHSVSKLKHIDSLANAMIVVTVFQIFQLITFVIDDRINYSFALALVPGSIIGSYLGTRVMLTKGLTYFKFLIALVTVVIVVKLLRA